MEQEVMASYLDILAEQDTEARQGYEYDPKSLFVQPNEYEEDVDAHNAEEHDEKDLPDKEAFNKFAGNRTEVELQPELPKYEDHTTRGVRYENKDIVRHVLNIDTRFRENPYKPLSNPGGTRANSFTFKLHKTLKNIISVRVSGVEIPNTSYDFSESRGNVKFRVNGITFQIPDGNYPDPTDLTTLIESILNAHFGVGVFAVGFSLVTGKITFSSTSGFTLDFKDVNSKRPFDFGIGYNLGFRELNYPHHPITPLPSTYTGEAPVDVIGSNYMFLSLADWNVVSHETDLSTRMPYFPITAKIVVTVPKNSIIYDNGSNTITKEYWFRQPTNIHTIPVNLLDSYGNEVDLQDVNYSFSLECVEVVNPQLYETLRN